MNNGFADRALSRSGTSPFDFKNIYLILKKSIIDFMNCTFQFAFCIRLFDKPAHKSIKSVICSNMNKKKIANFIFLKENLNLCISFLTIL